MLQSQQPFEQAVSAGPATPSPAPATMDAPEGVDIDEWDRLQDWMSDADEEENFDLEEAGNIESNFEKLLVVDNVPKVGEAKKAKLQGVLNKIYGQFGEIESIELPPSSGFAFVAFKTAEAAAQAVKQTNGFKLDKKHIFSVNKYSDLGRLEGLSSDYEEPATPEFTEPENLLEYLLDDAGRDQYVVRQGDQTEIYTCEGAQLRAEGSLVYGGEREREQGKTWCERYVAWSSHGTYLATFHRQGIALWGGQAFLKKMRFKHIGVECLQFSPCERYIVTWNGRDDGQDPNSLIIHDVATGATMRSFKVARGSTWPIMKWSHDDRLLARQTKDGVQVYETPSMKMLGKKPVRTDWIQSFDWCPCRNLFAYWAPDHQVSCVVPDNVNPGELFVVKTHAGDIVVACPMTAGPGQQIRTTRVPPEKQPDTKMLKETEGKMEEKPARVVLYDPVKRSEVRAKNLVSVSDIKLHWHSDGAFLCAQVLRHTKSRKTTFTNLETFRILDPNIPNETVDLRERVEHFSWEPSRERFGVIHGESNVHLSISFYTMGKLKGGSRIEKIYTITGRSANELFWSPIGNAVVLANTSSVDMKLEFWDVDEKLTTSTAEHYKCKEIAWDPSGRMIATVASQNMFGPVGMQEKLNNGFNIWSFQGHNLRRVQTQHFYQFLWRPRPKSQLSDAEKKEVSKNLKRYLQRFEKRDQTRLKRLNAAANFEKLEKLTEFRNRLAIRHEEYLRDTEERYATGLWKKDKEGDLREITEVTEELISEKITPYNP